MGWGKYIVHYPQGDPSCVAYPTFRVKYGDKVIANTSGQMTTKQIGDFFNITYYKHHLSTEYRIETQDMTLTQLESINRAILKLKTY